MFNAKSVTVIIPAFNRKRRLKEAIKSVLNQTFTDYSLAVVDDASTEDLGDCRNLVVDSGHHWIESQTNQGPAATRNEGAAAVPGDWVTFLDSDDTWHPEKLARQFSWHEQNPDCRISQVIENWVRNGARFSKPTHLQQPEGHIFAECVDRCAIGPSCVMIRRDLWDDSGGFDPWFRVCEDYELWLRIAVKEKVGLVNGEALVEKHGGHSDQLSTSVPALDRFRLVALAMFLNHPKCCKTNRELVIKAIEQKAKILAKGAARRDRSEWETFFNELDIPLSDAAIEQAKIYCTDPDE